MSDHPSRASVNPKKVYAPYVQDSDAEIRNRASCALVLEKRLSALGVQLRWPPPPFNTAFEEQIHAELSFQVRWQIKILQLSSSLSEEEREQIDFPLIPHSETSVNEYVAAYKVVVSKRPFWLRLRNNLGLGLKQRRVLTNRVSKLEPLLRESFFKHMLTIWSILGKFEKGVSGGHFMMGALPKDDKAFKFEKPRHEVVISQDMVVMKYVVTQKLYKTVMGNNPSYFKGADRPVESVSWVDAVTFANALSQYCGLSAAYKINGEEVICDWDSDGWRLPTEAEWEYLARGGEEHKYSGSNNLGDVAWYGEEYSTGSTHPVGQKASNGFGLFDMSGNVFEWTWDWYNEDYYSSDSVTDPRGPSSGSYRVYRGGSWSITARNARSSFRFSNGPSFSGGTLGFRFLRKK